MKIQIGPYEFDLSEPYAPGQPLSPVEAKVLNGVRSVRIRNILYKRLAKQLSFDGELLSPEALLVFQQEVAKVDEEFRFVAHEMIKVKRGTLQAEIQEVAEEVRRAEAPEIAGEEEESEALEEIAARPEVIEEASRRFGLRQEVAKNSLADLLED